MTVMSAGFNAMHFARELWRLARDGAPSSRRKRSMRAAIVAMVVINVALAAGALHPLASARFAWAETLAVGASLVAALLMTAMVVRERK